MLTRRTFWKKTIGVAAAVIAAVCGKSLKADEFKKSIPKFPEDVAPVDNSLFPLSSSARSMWKCASSLRCGKRTGPLMGVAVLYRAMIDQAFGRGQSFEEYISDCEKKDFEESMSLRTGRTKNFEECRMFPAPDFMPFGGLIEAARGKKNGEQFQYKGVRWMRHNNNFVPMSRTIKTL